VALTFDAEHPDRPADPAATDRLIERLDGLRVRATFFIQGRWAEANPTTARAIAEAGHLVGNHSHYHARMPLLTETGLAEDIAEAGRAIEAASGVDPRPWFRCPFGDGTADPRVVDALTRAGYRHVGWHVDGLDWDAGRSASTIEDEVRTGVAAQGDGAVILLHAWTPGMSAALVPTVDRLRDDGMTFVTIDELDHIPAAPSWA
jgi:peptidoglycan-N-acetylglucosamine deacetylase